MPALLLQEPNKMSQSRDHLDALKKEYSFGKGRGEIRSLLLEAETIQQRLTSNNDL